MYTVSVISFVALVSLFLFGLLYHVVYVPLNGNPVTLVTRGDTYTIRYFSQFKRIDINGNSDSTILSGVGSVDFCAYSGGYTRFYWASTGKRYARVKYWFSKASIMSAQQMFGLLETRITNFGVSPTRIVIGNYVTVSGKLQSHDVITWSNLGGYPVHLNVDGSDVMQTTTDSSGKFVFTWTPKQVGTFNLKVVYYGGALHSGSESRIRTVTVQTQDEYDSQSRRNEELMTLVIVGGLAIGGLYVIRRR